MRPFEFAEEPGTGKILCHVYPVDAVMFTEDEAMRVWNTSEFKRCALDSEQLDHLIAAAKQLQEDNPPLPSLELEESEPQPLLTRPVAQRINATCSIEISDDKMQAELMIVAAQGGRHIETTEVKTALDQNRVSHGVEFQWLSRLVKEAEHAEPGSEVRGIIAEGTQPASGVPSQFEFLVTPFEDRILQPQSRDDGTLDMHNLGDIEVVEVNQPLVRRIPSQPGESGFDVMGNTLFSEALKDTSFDHGEGSAVSPDDPHLLIATRHGVPLKLLNGMKVDEVLVVRDVDLHTGNVDYDGSVMIKGDVTNGMCVTASSDVYVNGFIENARINAAGNVVIKQGIIGKANAAKDPAGIDAPDACYIKGKNVMARYAQHAFIEAEDKVELGAQLLHCQVLHCRALHVGDAGKRKAKLVGGIANVDGELHVGTLGSVASTTTQINFDGKAQPIEAQITELQHKLDEKVETVDGLVEAILALKKLKPTAELIEKARKAKNTVDQMREETDNLIKLIDEKQQKIEALKDQVHIYIYGVGYANVELGFLDIRYKFKEERKPCQIGIVKDRWCNV
ncbi:MAG: FapA family protein [Pseudomonadales bacterium]|nr:FapA family protein [Pseudomonadales bacterium]